MTFCLDWSQHSLSDRLYGDDPRVRAHSGHSYSSILEVSNMKILLQIQIKFDWWKFELNSQTCPIGRIIDPPNTTEVNLTSFIH